MILAQVNREMAQIKERDHHWEDGIEVHLLIAQVSIPADVFRRMPISPAGRPGSTALQMDPPAESNRILSPPPSSSPSPTLDGHLASPECRAVRVRRGRQGVMRVDCQTSRRSLRRDQLVQYPRYSTNSTSTEQRAADSEVRGGFAIVGYSMQTMSLLLGKPAPMKG